MNRFEFPSAQSPLRAALTAYLALRLVTTVLMALIAWMVPVWFEPLAPHDPQMLAELENGSLAVRLLAAPWYRWDTVHYIEIARDGYADAQNTVWPPLYPLLIRLGMLLGLHPLFSALLVSNLAALAAFWMFFRLVAREWDIETARNSLVMLVVYPTAFFLVAGYSEALFMLCAVASLSAARQTRWLAAGLWAAAAVLTRHQGILLVLPMIWEGYRALKQKEGKWPILLAGLALPGIAMLAFGLYVHYGLGADWLWRTVSAGWEQHLGWPWEGLLGNIKVICSGTSAGIATSWLNLILALLTIILLAAGTRRFPISFLLFGWAFIFSMLVKVENTGVLGAAARYTLPILPIYILSAKLVKNKIGRMAWYLVSLLSQSLLLGGFYWWGYVT